MFILYVLAAINIQSILIIILDHKKNEEMLNTKEFMKINYASLITIQTQNNFSLIFLESILFWSRLFFVSRVIIDFDIKSESVFILATRV